MATDPQDMSLDETVAGASPRPELDTDGETLAAPPEEVATDGDTLAAPPAEVATDGDTLADHAEIYWVGSDPLYWDTDGGGASDAGEVLAGTDPVDGLDDGFGLGPPMPGVAGQPNTWTVSHATPGATVTVVAGSAPGSTAVPGCAGQHLDLAAQAEVGTAVADASGSADVVVQVPAAAAGCRPRRNPSCRRPVGPAARGAQSLCRMPPALPLARRQ